MIISVKNKNVIDRDIYLHDALFETMTFNYEEKSIFFQLYNDYLKTVYSIKFCNIIAFEMTTGDVWGQSPHVFDWQSTEQENQVLIDKIFNEAEKYDFLNPSLLDKNCYFESVMTFTSGNRLTIACESISIDKKLISS